MHILKFTLLFLKLPYQVQRFRTQNKTLLDTIIVAAQR